MTHSLPRKILSISKTNQKYIPKIVLFQTVRIVKRDKKIQQTNSKREY